MTKKRVFILGAGFSKQAGLPLATELTTAILDETELKDDEEMQEWVIDLKQRIAITETADGNASINVEQFFDSAKYDEELWRMKQQLSPVGRAYGPATPWRAAESIGFWLKEMEEQLVHVIWDAQQKATLDPIKRFTDHLLPSDTVITFNYDTLVECALSAQKKAWNHGLDDRNSGGVTALKMHGSVDWILLKRRPETDSEKFIKLFSKKDVNVEEHGSKPPEEEAEHAYELWRAKDTSTCNAVLEMDKTGLDNSEYFLGLAGLGSYKPLHKLPGSALTWFNAFDALRKADKIYVIGFSMSPYDTMTRFHFASVLRRRETSPQRVIVIDPKAVKLAPTFASVFGNSITPVSKKAEDVNWSELLRA